MKIEFSTYQFLLEEHGFTVVKKYESEEFGDASVMLKSRFLLLIYNRKKSQMSIDIASILDAKNNYDLALVKALIYKDVDLTRITHIEELNYFIKTDFNEIINLFKSENYLKTKEELADLERKRLLQMFPSINS